MVTCAESFGIPLGMVLSLDVLVRLLALVVGPIEKARSKDLPLLWPGAGCVDVASPVLVSFLVKVNSRLISTSGCPLSRRCGGGTYSVSSVVGFAGLSSNLMVVAL